MHARLYKDMILSPKQQRRMAAYWQQWARARRHLDTLLATACDHLQCLPLYLDLPSTFLSHLSCLCRRDDSTMHGVHASGTAGVVQQQEPEAAAVGNLNNLNAAAVADCAPRFLGQRGDEMVDANGAMDVLRRMHMLDRDLYIDNLSSQVPGVFVTSVQVRFAGFTSLQCILGLA